MRKQIFKNTLIVVFSVILLCSIFILGMLYDYYNDKVLDEMLLEIKYITQGVELGGIEYLKGMDEAKVRITWVAPDGTVLYDNRADITLMENHAERDEIHKAMISASGDSVRYSSTLAEKTIYHAVRLSNGSVVRVASKQVTVAWLMLEMLKPFVVVLLLAFIISAALTNRLSKQLIKPLDNINLEYPEDADVYEEMTPFIRKIIVQNREIKKTMKELKEQQEEFAFITDHMQEGIIVVDKNANILLHNKSVLTLFGIKKNIEQKSVLILNRTEAFRNIIDIALEGGHEERVIHVGEKFYNIYANSVINDNKVQGAIIIVADVTEKEERENLRREFSANVSHELKTPLTSISGIAEIIKNGIVDSKDIPRFAANIYDEARRLINLVEDIIKISQLDENNDSFKKESIDLYDMSEYVINHLEPVAKSKGIEMKLYGDHYSIKGVASIIEEMIYNLCDNAIKYNKNNGRVDVYIENTDDAGVKLSVKDTGIGIEKTYHDRIFERFYRVDKSHSKEIGGTGLGLSIVKHAAKLHNATIDLQSEPGVGTTITIIF